MTAAAFASKSFDAAHYQAFRPDYPQSLYDDIYAYHASAGGSFDVAVDVGCGTGAFAPSWGMGDAEESAGQTTRFLAKKFEKVIGVDPSETMLEGARKVGGEGKEPEYEVGAAESLPFLKDASVDLITAGPSLSPHITPHAEVGHSDLLLLLPLPRRLARARTRPQTPRHTRLLLLLPPSILLPSRAAEPYSGSDDQRRQ